MFGQDLSTPDDGNLYRVLSEPFEPGKIEVYNPDEILESNNIIHLNNRLYQAGNRVELTIKDKTINSDIVWVDDDIFVVLTGNSNRYQHGILGDKNESTGFSVYHDNNLISHYELQSPHVFETLRPLIADVVPENPGVEILLTSSDIREGAGIEVYSLSGNFLGKSESIGRGYRWLHVIGSAAFAGQQYIAVVKTPHINGILELYKWNGTGLDKEFDFTGVSTHQIGSDNLNMALILNTGNSTSPEILIPSTDYRTILFIQLIEGSLQEVKRFGLPGKLSTNIFMDNEESPSLWMGLTNGKIVRIRE